MAKRSKMGKRKAKIKSDHPVEEGSLSAEIIARIKSDPDGGLSSDILDVAFWREEHEPDDAWVAALDRLDRLGDKEPLKACLRSSHLPGMVGEYMADLIERGVKPAKGRPRIPAYKYSEADALLLLDSAAVSNLIRRGLSEKDALAEVARRSGRDEAKIANSRQGKRGSLNRKKKLLRP